MTKGIYKIPQLTSHLIAKTVSFLTWMSESFPLPVPHETGRSGPGSGQEAEIKGIQAGLEDIKPCLLTNDIILSIEDPEESTQEVFEQMVDSTRS